MGTIYIRDLRVHARHGVLEQEQRVGNDYILNISVDYPMEAACLSDDVAETLNYADIAAIALREMRVASRLLEHVAHRIATAILRADPKTHSVTVDIEKVAPPMKVDCHGAGVRLTLQQ